MNSLAIVTFAITAAPAVGLMFEPSLVHLGEGIAFATVFAIGAVAASEVRRHSSPSVESVPLHSPMRAMTELRPAAVHVPGTLRCRHHGGALENSG